MTREEHLAWCKTRALEYVETRDLHGAFASMMSDLNKHEETKNHPNIHLGLMLISLGNLTTQDEMRHFIEEFN